MGLTAEEIARAILGGAAPASPRLRVPSNLVPVIEAVSDQTGVPFEVIAGVIQTEATSGTSGDWPAGIVPELIVDVALRLKGGLGPRGEAYAGDWRLKVREVFGGGRSSWMDRFDSIVYARGKDGKADYSRPEWIEREPSQPISGKTRVPKIGDVGGYYIYPEGGEPRERPVDIADVYQWFDSFTGRPPSEAEARKYVGLTYDAMRASILALPESQRWRQIAPQVQETRRWADSIFFDYYGRAPSIDEVVEISQRGHTPESLKRYFAEQPYGGTTLGQFRATRSLADDYARRMIGRESDPGEVNWLITHNIGTPEGIEAYYEQLRTRIETGDESFAWAVDPRTWRQRQSDLASAWKQAGLLGDPPPQMVNRSLAEKWDAERTEDEISALPAPGFAEGTTVGQVNRVRSIASRYKAALFPGQDVTKSELQLLMNEHPEEVRRYYRSLPAETHFKPDAPAPKGDKEMGAGALRGIEYTEPEKIDIKPAPLPGGIGG